MWRYKNSTPPTSTLTGSITSTSVSIPVAACEKYPRTGDFVVQIDSENILITGKSALSGAGNLTTVLANRGYEGTTAASHSNLAPVNLKLTERSLLGLYFYDVRAYGALGIGASNNDAAAIQAAMDDCGAKGGGIVFIPGGWWELDTTSLRFKYDGVIVRGVGRGYGVGSGPGDATLLVFRGVGTGAFVNDNPANQRTSCGVEGMQINIANGGTNTCGIRLDNLYKCQFRDLYINGAGIASRGLWFSGDTVSKATYYNEFFNVDIQVGDGTCVYMDTQWVNRNKFYGGEWYSSDTSASRAVAIVPSSDFSDTNVFMGVSMNCQGPVQIQLGGSGGAAADNAFIGCSIEYNPGNSGTVEFATSSGIAVRNYFALSYVTGVTFNNSAPANGNVIIGWDYQHFGILRLGNGITPGNPSSGGFHIYVESGALKAKSANGTVTTLANL